MVWPMKVRTLSNWTRGLDEGEDSEFMDWPVEEPVAIVVIRVRRKRKRVFDLAVKKGTSVAECVHAVVRELGVSCGRSA